MKQFIGTCVSNPFDDVDELEIIVDDAKEISQDKFLDICNIDDEVKAEMSAYPHDYGFFKSKWCSEVYFFTWSCIEHFFA